MLRAIRGRWRLVAGILAVVLAAGGAFLIWGPSGTSSGPLSIASLESSAAVPSQHGVLVAIPVSAPAADPVVIDSVTVSSSGPYAPPVVTATYADPDTACGGIWFPKRGARGFLSSCTKGSLLTLAGQRLPLQPAALLSSAQQGGQRFRSMDITLQVAVPDNPAGCWQLNSVVIDYHVGSQAYQAKRGETVTGCLASASLANNNN